MSKIWKKLLAVALTASISAGAAIAGTVAYLQDSDSDVNVMTLGNVKIEQHEYERVVDANGNYTTIDVAGTTSYELTGFTQAKPLYPFVGAVDSGYDPTPVRLGQLGHNSRGGMDVLPAKNVQDKFVVVENTGKSDAYVRTIVGFEAGSVVEEDWYKLVSYSAHFTWKETQDWFVTEVDGNTLESKKVKGAYIVGEMLDVDGDCGGYNLQWAYSSARAVCCEVKEKYGL